MQIPDNIERRGAPRYNDKIQVDLVLADDEVLPVEICSISVNGLQFTCDGWLADEIEPMGIQKLAMTRKPLIVVSELPFGHYSKHVVISSNVTAVRRLAQDKFLIGLEFNEFEENGESILKDYIEQLRLDAISSEQH